MPYTRPDPAIVSKLINPIEKNHKGEAQEDLLAEWDEKLQILLNWKTASLNLSERIKELKSYSDDMVRILEKSDIFDPKVVDEDNGIFSVEEYTAQTWVDPLNCAFVRNKKLQEYLSGLIQDHPELAQELGRAKEISHLVSDSIDAGLISIGDTFERLDHSILKDPKLDALLSGNDTKSNST
ncbi:hypothetical protein F5Y11DRAFT_351739 [Daldinia sp. FL1419]|nr:hypothetical protein F5Y11DRAFT_351739 [Daldinia sp. FL1419]